MTAKAISKKLKAKGLGRLRWYCQMCEKQCRDENGFQCHVRSESHKRLLGVFTEAPQEFLSGFSERFRREFLAVVRQRYGTSFVQANAAYQEYIKDRHHLHMNATRWTTLTDFVKDLGRSARCTVELRESGYWIRLVDKDAAGRAAAARDADRIRADEIYRNEARLVGQMKAAGRAMARDGGREVVEETVAPSRWDTPVRLQTPVKNRARCAVGDAPNVFEADGDDAEGEEGAPEEGKVKRKSRWGPPAKKMSALEEIMRSKQSLNKGLRHMAGASLPGPRADAISAVAVPKPKVIEEAVADEEEEEAGWVMKGIEVRVMNKSIGGGKYHQKKGRIVQVVQEFGAMVKLFESGVVLQLDQDDLETVVPGIGGNVVLLRGVHRGRRAAVVEWHDNRGLVSLRLEGTEEMLDRVKCEHVSRAA